MSTGWRYSIQIPAFTKEERHGEEIVVYYQVDVLVQGPGNSEPAPPTPVWRRFSEFRQLHSNLKNAFPEVFKTKELEPPSKQSLRFVNNNDRLLHSRRKQLERWLWSLLSHNEIAQSRYMRLFLQLNLAATRASTTAGSVTLSQEDRDEENHLETSSELSGPSVITAITDGLGTPGTTRLSIKENASEAYRMGLRVDHRLDLKRLMKSISTSLEQVTLEAQDVRGENQSLAKENQSLEEEIDSLRQMVNEGKSFQNERNEELAKMLDTKEGALKQAFQKITRLENSLKDSQRQCEALQSEMTTTREEHINQTDKQQNEKLVVESKLQNQLMLYSKLEHELHGLKEKSKQDNLLLAKEVKTLRNDRKSLMDKMKEQEESYVEIERLKNEKTELLKKLDGMEMHLQDQKIGYEAQIQIENEKWKNKWMMEQTAVKQRHHEEVEALKDIIQDLEKSIAHSPSNSSNSVQFVIKVSEERDGRDPEHTIKENLELREKVELSSVELEELSRLKLTMKDLLKENSELKTQVDSQLSPGENGNSPREALGHFSDLVDGLYQDLSRCYEKTKGLEDVNSGMDNLEANVMIEEVAESNGRLELLKAKVQEMKTKYHEIPMKLLSAVSQLFSESIQKCLEINEMKIHAFLSRNLESKAPEVDPKSGGSGMKKISPRHQDSSSEVPSMKMLFGGIGAKMSQGSQGFMNFMQRGNGTGTGGSSTQVVPPSPSDASHPEQEETS